MLLPMLRDMDTRVLRETLAALANMPGDVSSGSLLPLLSHADPVVRGAAALALAKHQPDVAAKAVPAQLHSEVNAVGALYGAWVQRGKSQLSQDEIDRVMGYYRCQVKMLQAISMMDGIPATQALEEQAFRSGQDFSQMNGVIAAFQLWDRVGQNPQPAVRALGAEDVYVADKAEWMLIQAGPQVLPAVREALRNENAAVRERAIRVEGWQGDVNAVPMLRRMRETDSRDAELLAWAIQKIEVLHPKMWSEERSAGQ
jgi:glycerophosphoryl diester phosphodiesterase